MPFKQEENTVYVCMSDYTEPRSYCSTQCSVNHKPVQLTKISSHKNNVKCKVAYKVASNFLAPLVASMRWPMPPLEQKRGHTGGELVPSYTSCSHRTNCHKHILSADDEQCLLHPCRQDNGWGADTEPGALVPHGYMIRTRSHAPPVVPTQRPFTSKRNI